MVPAPKSSKLAVVSTSLTVALGAADALNSRAWTWTLRFFVPRLLKDWTSK